MKVIILIYIQTICSLLAFGQIQDNVPNSELKEIFRLAIDLPELQQYYHVDVDSTRNPLVIKEFGTINSDNLKGLKKFGQEVHVLNEQTIKDKCIKAYITIGDWTYVGNKLRLQMDYSIEGVLINIMLHRINGQWQIVDSVIFEE